MKIETILTPAEIARIQPGDNQDAACVVFDVLRATTSMVTALASGALAIHPVLSIPEALALRKKIPGALLGGERNGDRIAGFDLGNSPSEYTHCAGKEIITTTTNGTVALRACASAPLLLAASFPNLGVTAGRVRRAAPDVVRVVCAGTFETFALEDAIGAGLFISRLLETPPLRPPVLCDASIALLALVENHRDSWRRLAGSSRNARALRDAGREKDIEDAFQLDSLPVAAIWQSGCLRADTTGGDSHLKL